MTRAGTLAWAGGAVGAGFILTAVAVCTRVRVSGESMLPALEPGDRLLVVKGLRPRRGDLVAVDDPRLPGRLLVKRVHALLPGAVDVRGDNEDGSTDSRHFGPLPASSLRGRVVYRYSPAGRAGLLPGVAGLLPGRGIAGPE